MKIFRQLKSLAYRIGSFFLRRPFGYKKLPPFEVLQYREYADWALDVYSDTGYLKSKYGPSILVEGFPKSNLRAFILPQTTRNILSVRGTSNLRNALLDLDLRERAEQDHEINFHNGFEKCAMDILPWIEAHLPKDKPAVLTGHSLGGAIAAVLLHILRNRGYQITQAVTFGQPKVTNVRGVAKLRDLPLLRVVHEGDPVTMVPPVELVSLFEGFYGHFGTEVLIQDDGSAWFLEEHVAERFEVSSFWLSLTHLHPFNHKMDSYIRALDRIIHRKS